MRLTKEYNQYINSPRWQAKRQQALKFYGSRCMVCRSQQKLQVNHLSYENFGNERMSEMSILCSSCHVEYGKLWYKLGRRTTPGIVVLKTLIAQYNNKAKTQQPKKRKRR